MAMLQLVELTENIPLNI